MNKKRTYLLLGLLAICQISIPLYMAWIWEDTLKNGTAYTFAVKPHDPADALRGRYLYLRFEAENIPLTASTALDPQVSSYYAKITVNASGFAELRELSTKKPSGEFLEVKLLYSKDNTACVELPFSRYYLNEDLADRLPPNLLKEGAYTTVKVKNGYGVINQLFIQQFPIESHPALS